MANAAIIRIDAKFILDMLAFQGGKITAVRQDFTRWKPGDIEFVIEHPDLPEVKDGYELQIVEPVYVVETRTIDGKRYTRINREH